MKVAQYFHKMNAYSVVLIRHSGGGLYLKAKTKFKYLGPMPGPRTRTLSSKPRGRLFILNAPCG